MKRIKSRKGIFAAATALLLALAIWAGLTPPVSVSAAAFEQPPVINYGNPSDYEYGCTIERYSVDMQIESDRTVTVEETITASFSGVSSRGIIRDLPIEGGIRYRNLSAVCLNSVDFHTSIKTEDSSFLSYYLRGSEVVRGQERTYQINYEMIVPALPEEGYLPLDIIGYGWQAKSIKNVTVNVTVPEGLKEYKVYSGSDEATENNCGVKAEQNGNTLTLSVDRLPRNIAQDDNDVGRYYTTAGITLDLSFEAGVLSTSFDTAILYALGIGLALLLVSVLVKVFVCRQPELVKTVNLTAPNEMDPLLMGTYIDSKVDGEDLGALVFWLASKGKLHIDLTEDKKNPTLYRSSKPLPSDAPPHIRIFYDGLFGGRESVRISQLNSSFYQTADAVKESVKAQTGKLFTKTGNVITGLFYVLTIVLLGGFTFLYPLLTVAKGYYYWFMAASILVVVVVSAMGSVIATGRRFKWKLWKRVLCAGAFTALALGVGTLFCLLPSAALSFWAKFLLVLFAAAEGVSCAFFAFRTPEYSKTLGHILGFKQFIEFTERDKIEFMLKEDPELYYNILPYAQVLGVTDVWTEKFKGLNMDPPSYASYGIGDFVFDYLIWSSVFRSLNLGLAKSMISKPSSSGGGGRFGGGFGGGGGRGC